MRLIYLLWNEASRQTCAFYRASRIIGSTSHAWILPLVLFYDLLHFHFPRNSLHLPALLSFPCLPSHRLYGLRSGIDVSAVVFIWAHSEVGISYPRTVGPQALNSIQPSLHNEHIYLARNTRGAGMGIKASARPTPNHSTTSHIVDKMLSVLAPLLYLSLHFLSVRAHGYVQDVVIGSTHYTGYLPYSDPYYNPPPERIIRKIPGNGTYSLLSSRYRASCLFCLMVPIL